MRARSLSAREMFRMRYPGGGKNFMTPHVVGYRKINQNVAAEISMGRAFMREGNMYGVTVIAKGKKGMRSLYDKSKTWDTKLAAEGYLDELKGKMRRYRRR